MTVLPGADRIVGKADARREALLRLRRELLVVVPQAKVQREVRRHPPLILDEPVPPVVVGIDLDVSHHDREP